MCPDADPSGFSPLQVTHSGLSPSRGLGCSMSSFPEVEVLVKANMT